ncbi:MFS general substrate transporter [Clavulina sp. PMI_390]|nr:MFS general substrate transporter [Clavulina sp. PMI_390]
MDRDENAATHETERTSLIAHSTNNYLNAQSDYEAANAAPKGVSDPLSRNWRPIVVLLLLNAVQPLAYELVFPFINQMLLELQVVDDPEQVGFYSGLIESIFSVTSFITILPLSYATDRYGRKPVILTGMTGLGVSLLFFGMSRSFIALVISRCIGGGMGGVWAAVKVMLGELTDKSTQDQAFVGLMVSYRVGQIVGLPIGGFLAHPERHWSRIFDTAFWRTYPFALPCFVGAGVAFFAVGCGIFLLPETLYRPQRKKHEVAMVHADETGNVVPEVLPETPQSSNKVSWREIMTRDVVALLISNFLGCISMEILFTVYALFAFTPIKSGGLGFSESQIGASLSIRAVIQIGIMFLYQPLLAHRWIGTGSAVRIYKVAMFFWPVSCACYPLLNVLARGGMDVNGWMFWTWLCGFFLLWSLSGLSWAAISIMSNNAAPSAEALATLNGITQMSLVVPQAFTPAFTTSLFAYCVERQLLGGYLQWIIFSSITLLGAFQSLMLKEPTHDWREDAQIAREAETTTIVPGPASGSASERSTAESS